MTVQQHDGQLVTYVPVSRRYFLLCSAIGVIALPIFVYVFFNSGPCFSILFAVSWAAFMCLLFLLWFWAMISYFMNPDKYRLTITETGIREPRLLSDLVVKWKDIETIGLHHLEYGFVVGMTLKQKSKLRKLRLATCDTWLQQQYPLTNQELLEILLSNQKRHSDF